MVGTWGRFGARKLLEVYKLRAWLSIRAGLQVMSTIQVCVHDIIVNAHVEL